MHNKTQKRSNDKRVASAAAPARKRSSVRASERLGPDRDLPHDAVIAERLIRDIVSGVYQPGQWIREQEIAERFGVSRTPVRNAFRHVARAGFIDVRPWRGAQVLQLSADDTRHVLDLLEVLYGVAMRIAAETLPDKYFPEVEALLAAGEAAGERGAVNERIVLSFELGRRISLWSASPLAYDMLERVGNLARWQHRFFDFDVRALVARSTELHRELVDAIKARRAAEAERAARAIVSLTRDFLIPRIRLAETEAAGAGKKAPSRPKRAGQLSNSR